MNMHTILVALAVGTIAGNALVPLLLFATAVAAKRRMPEGLGAYLLVAIFAAFTLLASCSFGLSLAVLVSR